MKLPTCDKTTNMGVRPHIKKGYYPGKLLNVSLFKDKDGSPREGKYGRQLIFEFAIYKGDPETDKPIEPIMSKIEGTSYPVKISKFVYHEYKKMDKNQKWIDGEFQTAITPNSAITKILKALGWKFSSKEVDPEEFIGNWVELNIDDYTFGEGDQETTMSSIKDINQYKGPKVEDVEEVSKSEEPKKVTKQIKHESVKESNLSDNEEIKNKQEQISKLKRLHKDGFLTESGLKQSVEQLEAQIEELKRK